MKTSLSNGEKENFLLYLYFGNIKDEIETSIEKAYLDFSRTLHGFQKQDNSTYIKDMAKALLKTEIIDIANANICNQHQFDKWHKECCDKLILKFEEFPFHYGQAQKWINMTFKYLLILDCKRIESIYGYLHIPLDNIILENLERFGAPAMKCAWSRISNYDDYMDFQMWFRNKFEGNPLDDEFKIWLDETANLVIKKNEEMDNIS